MLTKLDITPPISKDIEDNWEKSDIIEDSVLNKLEVCPKRLSSMFGSGIELVDNKLDVSKNGFEISNKKGLLCKYKCPRGFDLTFVKNYGFFCNNKQGSYESHDKH